MTAAEALNVDIDHLRSWIGREDLGSDVLTEDLARKYHATFDLAGEAPKRGEIAPRMIHVCLAQPAVPTAQLGPDGHPERGGFLPPVPLPRRMWAGSSQSFHGDLRVGDEVRRISRIADVVYKAGRTGALCFVTVQHQIEGNGRLVLEERQDIVYRNLEATGATPKTPPPAEAGTYRRPMEIEPPLLLRYSALTFNAHRIHYDRSYVTGVEGYPGLIVHGPLIATLLVDLLAREMPQAVLREFNFRAVGSLFDIEPFTLCGKPAADGRSVALWAQNQRGELAMQAQALLG